MWSLTFSDLFWPTSEPSIATHSTEPGIRRRDTWVYTAQPQKTGFSLFSFPDFVVRIAGYYVFEYRSLRARLQSRDRAPFRNAHNRTHNMFISDGTQDRLDRLNSSHSERDFSMANHPSPVLGRSPRQRRGQRSAVFSFYGKPKFVEEISQKTKRRTASGPGESLHANSFVYKLQPCCRYKCLLPNCGVFRIQDGHGTFSLMRHLARMPDRHHRHAHAAVVVYNGRSQCDPVQIAMLEDLFVCLFVSRCSRSPCWTSPYQGWTLRYP